MFKRNSRSGQSAVNDRLKKLSNVYLVLTQLFENIKIVLRFVPATRNMENDVDT